MTEIESTQDRKIRKDREKIDAAQKAFYARQRLIDKLIEGAIYLVFLLGSLGVLYAGYLYIKAEPFRY